jgi:hypothetical protein
MTEDEAGNGCSDRFGSDDGVRRCFCRDRENDKDRCSFCHGGRRAGADAGPDDVFEKEGDSFFGNAYTGVVPLGEDVICRAEDVKDFWEVVGENTDYTDDPEEIMADNFAYAIMDLDIGYEERNKSPEILEGIRKYLK